MNPHPAPGSAGWRELLRKRSTWLIAGAALTAAGTLIGFSLVRPTPPAFVPSPIAPSPAGDALVGPRSYTVDASDSNRWVYFSFASGSVIENPGPFDWDLAFRRFHVIVNGGEGFPGMGGAARLSSGLVDSLRSVPQDGYEVTHAGRDSVNTAIERWYDYSFLSHLLTPKDETYAIRTADGRYAALSFLGYYCPGARPGCVTFRYVFQGGGGTELVPR